jgi:hypothetical protein
MSFAAASVERSGIFVPGHPLTLYQDWLGEAHAVELLGADVGDEFSGSRRHRFRLQLWPQADFTVCEHPHGWSFNLGFVRANEHPAPRWEYAADLAPWYFVIDDMRGRFGPGRLVDGWAQSQDIVYDLIPGAHLPRRPHLLQFDFGLLQACWPIP